ncbi:MAG: hypothetical protein ABI627_18805 [Polyangiaceae bacterium]
MRLSFPVVGLLLFIGSVSCAATPHQGGLYRVGVAEPDECSHVVHLLTAEQVPSAYRELAQVSATCPYVSPRTCERILLSRACELDADAVVIRQTRVIGRKGKPQLADDALVIGYYPVTPRP